MYIRQYIHTDQSAVLELHEAALKPTGAFIIDPELDADLFDIEKVYLSNRGEFLVGIVNDKIIAMGALKHVDQTKAEIKRMRVHPEHQRKGYGQKVLEQLESRAKELTYTTLVLDTGAIQIGARKLYERNGFNEIGRGQIKDLETVYYQKTLSS